MNPAIAETVSAMRSVGFVAERRAEADIELARRLPRRPGGQPPDNDDRLPRPAPDSEPSSLRAEINPPRPSPNCGEARAEISDVTQERLCRELQAIEEACPHLLTPEEMRRFDERIRNAVEGPVVIPG